MTRLELRGGGYLFVRADEVVAMYDVSPARFDEPTAYLVLRSGHLSVPVQGSAQDVAERLGFAHPTDEELGLGPDRLPGTPTGTFQLEGGGKVRVHYSRDFQVAKGGI